MGDYFVPILDVLIAAGCGVEVNDINEGWERRSRSSGGFDGAPIGVQWHHTASSASVDSDLNYMIHVSDDEPVGNVLLGRDGIYRPIAGGAANTSGKGGPNQFSRGRVEKDTGNTRLFSIEIANNGVGEAYPKVQIDAAFAGSNALNHHFGNLPSDVVTHALGSGDGYTDRKIDPATAGAVQGPWKPGGVNSSGTWSLVDLRNECEDRSVTLPPPPPPPPWEDEMPSALLRADDDPTGAIFWWDGKHIGWIRTGTAVDVGIVTGLYFNSQPPLSNFSKEELQRMIDSGWDGGPIPPGFTAPTHTGSGVS